MVCFITVNPDTAAFSAHMDWIIGYVGCSGTVWLNNALLHAHTHTHLQMNTQTY